MSIPVNVLMVGWYYAIRQGKQWAKWLLLVVTAVALAHSLMPHRRMILWGHIDTNGLYATRFVLSYGGNLMALGLLFYKPKHAITSVQP